MLRVVSMVLIAVSALVTGAAAHELYFATVDGVPVLCRGHADAGAGHGAPAHHLSPEDVDAIVVSGSGGLSGTAAEDGWPRDAGALFVSLSSGYWTRTREGTVNARPDTVAGALSGWHATETIKWVRAAGANWNEAMAPDASTLEIVPEEDPFALRAGDKLTVRVFRGGAPVEGAVVTYGGRPRGVTDGSGRINIRLRRAGMQLLTATEVRPDPDGICDERVATTTLQFEME